jgi:hypothetical protein
MQIYTHLHNMAARATTGATHFFFSLNVSECDIFHIEFLISNCMIFVKKYVPYSPFDVKDFSFMHTCILACPATYS